MTRSCADGVRRPMARSNPRSGEETLLLSGNNNAWSGAGLQPSSGIHRGRDGTGMTIANRASRTEGQVKRPLVEAPGRRRAHLVVRLEMNAHRASEASRASPPGLEVEHEPVAFPEGGRRKLGSESGTARSGNRRMGGLEVRPVESARVDALAIPDPQHHPIGGPSSSRIQPSRRSPSGVSAKPSMKPFSKPSPTGAPGWNRLRTRARALRRRAPHRRRRGRSYQAGPRSRRRR